MRGVEAELEEFRTTFISDEILPPETAVTEAEHRLKTRLDVLVGQFSVVKNEKNDIFQALSQLLIANYSKAVSSYRFLFFRSNTLVRLIKYPVHSV